MQYSWRGGGRATSFPRPEPHLNARPQIIFIRCAIICRLKIFFKNPATLGHNKIFGFHIESEIKIQ